MRLGAIFLLDCLSVNSFRESEHVEFNQGDTIDIYFQLRDMSVQSVWEGYKNPGRRYMPIDGATLSVLIDTMDQLDAIPLTKAATQPFVQDPSIWKFTVLATDPVRGTKRLKLTLTEPIAGPSTVKTYGIVNSALLVGSVD